MDDERGRSRVQSSVRLRRIGRRCNGCFGEEVENCATAVSLRGWFRARNSVSVLPFLYDSISRAFATPKGRRETALFFFFLVHESSRIASKTEDAEHAYQITIGGRAKSVDRWPVPFSFYPIFDISTSRKYLFSRNSNCMLKPPFSKSQRINNFPFSGK